MGCGDDFIRKLKDNSITTYHVVDYMGQISDSRIL